MDEIKNKVILLSSEGCSGEDTELGFAILATLLDALKNREDRPRAIIFWNTAVKLLSEKSCLSRHLKKLEEEGVAILAGRLCINELELADKLVVGRPATMDEILDVILHNEVISL